MDDGEEAEQPMTPVTKEAANYRHKAREKDDRPTNVWVKDFMSWTKPRKVAAGGSTGQP